MVLKKMYILLKNSKVTILLLIVMLGLVYDLVGLGGNVRFYTKWIQCGNRPIVADQSLGFGASVPNYANSPVLSLLRMSPEQFCSPRDAELAGYSASRQSHEYPHLTDTERECLALMRNDLPYDPEACKDIQQRE